MGTETSLLHLYRNSYDESVKLNNPLMGTETVQLLLELQAHSYVLEIKQSPFGDGYLSQKLI